MIGIYSYIVFSLGILGVLYKEIVFSATAIYIFIAFNILRKDINSFDLKVAINALNKKTKLVRFIILLLFVQAAVNFIGALGPELGFDALWYHLTIPKIFLDNHSAFHIPGGLLYYSGMPKLTEMIYLGVFANDTLSKLIHFGFGILTLFTLYKLSRNFLDEKLSLLVVLIFYSNLVIGWQSITAYVDLARTFFETMTVLGFVNWIKERKIIWLYESAVMLGFALSVKLLSFASLPVFLFLIVYYLWKQGKIKNILKTVFAYVGIVLFVPLPYFIFSLLNTGNPIYPVFSEFFKFALNLKFINPLSLSDPISPVYFIFLPFLLFYFRKLTSSEKLIAIYTGLAFIIWYLTPQTGGGRFIMPYLPALSLVTVFAVKSIYKYKNLWKVSIAVVILVSLISILYRGAANLKYLPVIFGIQSRDQFLSNNLNFSYGDFYDTDGYFKTHIKSTDKVLLFGFHNLYYVNFPFIHSSYVKKGDRFDYIATQNTDTPERFMFWNLVYSNERTGVNLYSLGGQEWTY